MALHRSLDELAGEGVTHLAMEASSHGLDQRRLDGVRVAAGAFTNLSRDHLDYHPTLESYLAAKLRLFTDLIVPDGAAVIVVDHEVSEQVVAAARGRGLRLLTVGRRGEDIRLLDTKIDGFAQVLRVAHAGREWTLRLPLVGTFQVENALIAAGLAIATGGEPSAVFAALEHLEGAKGRLDFAGERNGAPVFVDYAHKPDALAKALEALRPYVTGRLIVVFGCGGDRDPGKRPMMGEIAAQLADRVIVTDDNPRSENPAAIRAAILAAAPGATEIGDRAEAIRVTIGELHRGDVLLIAGKGHETGQIVGEQVLPFSDHEAVAAALHGEGGMSEPLWTIDAMASAMDATRAGRLPAAVAGLSIDTRTLKPGEAFFAIKGDARDGHDFVAGRAEGWRRYRGGRGGPCREFRRRAAADRSRRARRPARSGARFAGALAGEDHRGHRLGRQDQHQGGAAHSRCRATARPTPRSPRTTITGACRCRSRAARRARAMRCSRSA